MRVIIVGIGKVGSTLTEYLRDENHEITIIDKDAVVVEEHINKYDVSGVVGNGASFNILLEAGITKADLIIATTELDELNILACIFSKKYGVKYAAARIRDPEYATQISFFNKELDIDYIINPELEAANEISQILRFPLADHIETFANNKVEMVSVVLKNDSKLLGKSLLEVKSKYKLNFLISAIERDGIAIIPNGKFILKANDTILVTGAKSEILSLFKELGLYKNKAKNIMIAGGGIISYYLAKQLLEAKRKVTIIEQDRLRAKELKELLPQAYIIHGDANNKDLLIEEGIKDKDAFITLTGFDEANIILSLFAKSINVPKVITKINKLSYYDMINTLDLSSIISPKLNTANQILRYVRSLQNAYNSRVETLYRLMNNQVEALEFIIKEDSKVTNIKLKDLPLKQNILIAIIIRGQNIIIPAGLDMLLIGDRVVIITNNQNITELDNIRE